MQCGSPCRCLSQPPSERENRRCRLVFPSIVASIEKRRLWMQGDRCLQDSFRCHFRRSPLSGLTSARQNYGCPSLAPSRFGSGTSPTRNTLYKTNQLVLKKMTSRCSPRFIPRIMFDSGRRRRRICRSPPESQVHLTPFFFHKRRVARKVSSPGMFLIDELHL